MEILNLFLVDLSLLEYSLLETKSFLNEPVVLLLGLLSLLAPESFLVFLLHRHLVVLFGTTHLL